MESSPDAGDRRPGSCEPRRQAAAPATRCQSRHGTPDPAAHAVLLTFFDIETAHGQSTVELQAGDFPSLGLTADLLVVSAFERSYAPVPGTLIGRLHEAYGLQLKALPIALDLRSSPLKCWVSAELDWPDESNQLSRFRRIAVIEGLMEWSDADDLLPWPPFNRLFSLLALLPMRQIACATVASPLLGSGNQGLDVVAHYPELLNAYHQAFRHVPELERLILFDKTDTHLQVLGEAIDAALERPAPQSMRLRLPGDSPAISGLHDLLSSRTSPFTKRSLHVAQDIRELLTLLGSDEVSLVSLGNHGRRVVEQLVLQSLSDEEVSEKLTLYKAIRRLQQRGVHPWVIQCLHQVRCFGNWMGHPPRGGQVMPVELHDVLAMLSSLQRVLQAYPWLKP
jgi:hypothetical protein